MEPYDPALASLYKLDFYAVSFSNNELTLKIHWDVKCNNFWISFMHTMCKQCITYLKCLFGMIKCHAFDTNTSSHEGYCAEIKNILTMFAKKINENTLQQTLGANTIHDHHLALPSRFSSHVLFVVRMSYVNILMCVCKKMVSWTEVVTIHKTIIPRNSKKNSNSKHNRLNYLYHEPS